MSRARLAIEADIRQLSLEFPRLPPTDKSAASKELADKRGEANDLRRQETAMRAQLPKLQQSLAAEQTRHNELSGRLDEMEKSLAAR